MGETSGKSIATRELIRVGLQNLDEARASLARLQKCRVADAGIGMVLNALGDACDPDVALRNLAAIAEFDDGAVNATGADGCSADEGEGERLPGIARILADETASTRLIRVLGASGAMGGLMRSRPGLVRAAAYDACGSVDWDRSARTGHMLEAVKADERRPDNGFPVSRLGLEESVEAMRRSYYNQLAAIMAFDLVSADPLQVQPRVSRRLSDLADAALETALAIARHETEGAARCRFAIVAMGKLGARELNYVSDVDLMYVVEPVQADGDAAVALGTAALTRVGTALATCMQRVCQKIIPGVAEPPLWQIDTALRPEGRDGVLVRRMESYRGYYGQWAENWEFQALLKARSAAGDPDLGGRFVSMVQPMVWQASRRENFVHDCQKMRVRVEEDIEPSLRDREIKLGKGGLRDVEFAVQMLQLVHGRTDETLRRRSTLDALAALASGGYISHSQADRLSEDYRFERVLEHRQQMWRLKRTHLFADLGASNTGGLTTHRTLTAEQIDDNAELRRLARAFGMLPDRLLQRYDRVRREIRHLHEDIYYRPMLPINAQLTDEQVRLNEGATHERFASIGFQDPEQAMRHVKALTRGVSRAAKINRILLPAVLKWLSDGQNPDMGLLGWRLLEERFGDHSRYLGFLRDSPLAARRLCHVLSNSRLLGEALRRSVESVTWLGDDAKLRARSRENLDSQCEATRLRYADGGSIGEFATSLRALRRHEIERIGLGWMSGVFDGNTCLKAMTDVYDAVIASALRWAEARRSSECGLAQAPCEMAVIAMGRYGGGEVNFSSDADAILVYRPAESNGANASGEFAGSVVSDMRAILQGPVSVEPGIDLDLGLRPEGRNGPLVRSYESCARYYASWSGIWEHQALLRARFAAGDEKLGNDFLHNIADPLRYPVQPLNQGQVNEIRALKSRMESERLPHGVGSARHLKLGAGGLSDVEWTVQLLQLQHTGDDVGLRVNGTLPALAELERSSMVGGEDARALKEAWVMCTAARNGNYLYSGRASQADVIPSDHDSLGGVATFLGYDAHRGQYFENDIKAVMRRCRSVMERLFYGRRDG